jgi:3-hydroxy-9,10-secoandrosta-1,3,5(10)-triene-9,17-dione monooxygenase
MRVLGRGQRLARDQRQQIRMASATAAQMALGAVQRLFNHAGGRALFVDSGMQRALRDLYGVAAHRGLQFENAAAGYGSMLLGIGAKP